MRGVALALLSLGVAGCAQPEPYAFDPKVFLTRPMDEYQVNGTGFQMNFPRDGAGVQLPNALYLGGDNSNNAIGTGVCPVESMVGIGAYPAVLVSADTAYRRSSAEPVTSAVRVLETGTAVMRIAVDYTVPYACTSGIRRVIGTSTFTFFPSSRIVRHDSVTATDADLALSDCTLACPAPPAPNPTSWYFTSFWTFDTPTFVQPMDLAHPGGCAQIGENQLAVAWMGDGITGVREGFNAWATIYEFQGNTLQLGKTPHTVTSVLQIGFDEQAAMACRTRQATISDAPLTVDGRSVNLDEHGVYFDPATHNGPLSITAKNGDVAPFALLLDLGGARHARVSRNIGGYSIQEMTSTDNPDDFLFWFDDGITNFDEPFTIEPY